MTEPKTVLVVDGDPLVRWAIRQYLEPQGYLITEAEDAAGARAGFVGVVDAVLLDIRLPDEDGILLYRDLKNRRPQVPIILMSAHGDPGVGADSLTFLKPLPLDELSRTLYKVLVPNS